MMPWREHRAPHPSGMTYDHPPTTQRAVPGWFETQPNSPAALDLETVDEFGTGVRVEHVRYFRRVP